MRHPLSRVRIFLFLLFGRLSFLSIQIYNLLFHFCFFAFSIIFSVYCESGAIERNVTPGSVSNLVVKVDMLGIVSFELHSNTTVCPTLSPIHFSCAFLIFSGQSSLSKSFKSLPAYFVILSVHCLIGFKKTSCPPLSLLPFTISSFDRTVPSSGHQFAFAFLFSDQSSS